MDLRRLEIFVKVAELGSFSRAAETLFLTQPTVSEHVRALEDELGVPLLDRLGRGTTPTRAGVLLLGYARRMLTLSREAVQAIEQFQGRVSGELTVGGSSIPGEYIVPALIGAFRGKHPDVRISLLIGSSREVQQWVEEGQVEIGVVGDDLKAEPMIVRERGSGSRETFERALQGWASTSATSGSWARWPRLRPSSKRCAPRSACRSSRSGRWRTSAARACWPA
jgi:DNA-binding transcriptional LysR family regulator